MAKESTFKSMTICLFLVCLVCSALLGGVNILTQDKIAEEQVKKTNNAIAKVVPEFDNEPSAEKMTVSYGKDSITVYPAKKGGEVIGYAVESYSGNGFSGNISIMVGFDMDGNIVGTSVISHSETPGLGAKMVEEKFSSQFKGKNPATFRLAVDKNGGDVIHITASTITSTAYCEAVQLAYNVFQQVVNEN